MEIRFRDILEARFRTTLKKFIGHPLTPLTLRKVKVEMLDDVNRVFAASNVSVGDDVKVWLANQYFKHVELNGEEGTLLDLVIIKEHELSSFSNIDIETLYSLFSDTKIFDDIAKEKERRTQHGKETE